MKYKLDKEEKTLLKSLQEDTWVGVPDIKSRKKHYKEIAKQYLVNNQTEN